MIADLVASGGRDFAHSRRCPADYPIGHYAGNFDVEHRRGVALDD